MTSPSSSASDLSSEKELRVSEQSNAQPFDNQLFIWSPPPPLNEGNLLDNLTNFEFAPNLRSSEPQGPTFAELKETVEKHQKDIDQLKQ